MPWPNIDADGTLKPFTTAQVNALELAPCDIRQGDHPTFELDSQGCSVRRMWFCKWSQRDNAIAYILGAANLVSDASIIASLSRQMPQAIPINGYSQYVAMAVESCTGARSAGVNNLVAPRDVPSYTAAKLVVRYEQVFFGLGTDAEFGGLSSTEYNRYTERLPSSTNTSYLSLPGTGMNYRTESGAVPNTYRIPYNTGKVEVLKSVSYKWKRIPKDAWATGSPLYKRVYGDPTNTTIFVPPGTPAPPAGYGKIVGSPYIGTVNATEFLGFPPGQLLYEGVDEEIVPDPVSGTYCWNLTHKWSVKSNQGGPPNAPERYGGHNYLYYGGASSSTNNGYYLAVKGNVWVYPGHIYDGACLYNERNHQNLFKVGPVPNEQI